MIDDLSNASLLDALFLTCLFVVIAMRINVVEKSVHKLRKRVTELETENGRLHRRLDGASAARMRDRKVSESMVSNLLRDRAELLTRGVNEQSEWPLVLCAQCRLPIARDDQLDASRLRHSRCAV